MNSQQATAANVTGQEIDNRYSMRRSLDAGLAIYAKKLSPSQGGTAAFQLGVLEAMVCELIVKNKNKRVRLSPELDAMIKEGGAA